MKYVKVAPPTLAAIAATRGMLGVGVGLLLSKRLPRRRRDKVGWTLLGIGAASTIPLAIRVFRRGVAGRAGSAIASSSAASPGASSESLG